MPKIGEQLLLSRKKDQAHKIRKNLHLKIKGFTLIELLISVAIIAILSVISISSFQGSTRRQEVKGAAAELKADLRKIKNYAIATQKRPNNTAGCEDETALSHLVLARPPATYYNFFLAGDTGGFFGFACGVFYNYSDNLYPFNTDQVPVESVGKRVGPSGAVSSCVIAWIHFRPLNQRPNLHCGFDPSYFNPGTPTSLSGGADRVYFQLKHINTSETIRYRVYVTDQGVIYDEKQP